MEAEHVLHRLAAVALAFFLSLLGCTEQKKPEVAVSRLERAQELDLTEPQEKPIEAGIATFGGGCFWCTEAIYDRIDGVISVTSGFSGGDVEKPTYQQVVSGMTGHAEVIQIRFDPEKIDYLDLLKVFFETHDPTTLNRQGADVGTQYRSAIFWHDETQRDTAARLKKELDASGAFRGPIVTEITKFAAFWPAEGYHQDYYANNPAQGYCRAVVRPKVEKFEKAFKNLLKEPAKPGSARSD